MAYREAPVEQLQCPRCKQALPPTEVATCTCGTWVTAFAAPIVLTDVDRIASSTRWWKVRPACPMCGDKMALYGDEPGLLVGCEGHGYWVDADAIAHTGLARPIDHVAIEQRCDDDDAIIQSRVAREAAETERARAKAEKAKAEAIVREAIVEPSQRPAIDYTDPHVIEERIAVERAQEEARKRMRSVYGSDRERLFVLEQANEALESRVSRLEERVRELLRR